MAKAKTKAKPARAVGRQARSWSSSSSSPCLWPSCCSHIASDRPPPLVFWRVFCWYTSRSQGGFWRKAKTPPVLRMGQFITNGVTLLAEAEAKHEPSYLGLMTYLAIVVAVMFGLMASAKKDFSNKVFKNWLAQRYEQLYLFIENLCVGTIGAHGRKYIPIIMTFWLAIFTGNGNRSFAEAVANHLEVPMGNAEVFEFSNENIFVRILDNVREKDVFLVQPTCTPVNDNLMELMVMVDALKRASAGRITAAGLDVFEGEPKVHPDLLQANNVVLAPHIASSTRATRLAMANLAADNLISFFANGTALTPLNPEVLSST